MGVDIWPELTIKVVNPKKTKGRVHPEDIVEGISERYGKDFDGPTQGKWYAEDIRWSNMEDDMKTISAENPGVLFKMRYDWDGTAWVSWWLDGLFYEESQDDFNPRFNAKKLK